MPAPSQLRQLDENFVKHLEQEMKKLPEGNHEMVFALCTSRISKEQFDINNVSSYTFVRRKSLNMMIYAQHNPRARPHHTCH